MKPETYFKKYGCIYGISYKYAFGRWDGYSARFTSLDDALEWLNTEEYDFRTKELCSKTEALRYGEPYDMIRVMGADYFGDPVSRLEMMR